MMNRGRAGPWERGGAFTLVELMTTVAAMGVIAGIVLAAAGGVQKKSARDQARAEIKAMSAALERFRNDNGAYPRGTNSTTALYPNLTNYMTFRSSQISGNSVLDPYGRAYLYSSPGTNAGISMMDAGETFELWSSGPDGISAHTNRASRDDLASWQ